MPEAVLPEDVILCEGEQISVGIDQPGMSFNWSSGEDVCCINISETGVYALTVSNVCGEIAIDEIKADFSLCDRCILIPNAFSPNGDGVNDVFNAIVSCTMKSYRFNIYNRWGQLVFSSSKPGQGWDGTLNGSPADAGTYFYNLEAAPAIERLGKIREKGDIVLIR